MHKLKTVTISHANLTGSLPRHLHLNLTHVDLSDNKLKGKIPTSLTLLEDLEFLNFSSNGLNGEIPTEFGDLISLKNLSLASNSFSGSIPDSMSAIPGLVHVDLSNNQLNGTVPRFFSELKGLKVLNLANNELHGALPFNASFIKRLAVFKVGGNDNLCYNHSVLSSKMKLGIAPCDKHGLPMSPPPSKESSGDSESDSSDYDDDGADDTSKKKEHHHGPIQWLNPSCYGLAVSWLAEVLNFEVPLCLFSHSKWTTPCGWMGKAINHGQVAKIFPLLVNLKLYFAVALSQHCPSTSSISNKGFREIQIKKAVDSSPEEGK
ncbi:hypothetical protein REPUB_Repub13aG0228700 [Reevesia pubescens]